MDCGRLVELPREIVRRFLLLLDASENKRLSEQDQRQLLLISDYVDFRRFSVDRSPPRYMEGSLRARSDFIIVEWHDGKRERVQWHAGKALSEVNVGERFSAYVKLGTDDAAVGIERVSLLSPVNAQEDWNSWPTKS